MIFDIDTINERAEIVLFDDNFKEVGRTSISNKFEVAEKVLLEINGLMKNHRCSLSSLSAVLVNLGPGSYTGQRIGVTTANSIAFSLNIPVVGYEEGKRESAIKLLLNGRIQGKFSPVVPLYASAPKITKKN